MTTTIHPNATPNVPDGAEKKSFPVPGASQVPQSTREQWCNEHVAVFTQWKSKEDLANQWVKAAAEANPGIMFQGIVGNRLITHECSKGGGI